MYRINNGVTYSKLTHLRLFKAKHIPVILQEVLTTLPKLQKEHSYEQKKHTIITNSEISLYSIWSTALGDLHIPCPS